MPFSLHMKKYATYNILVSLHFNLDLKGLALSEGWAVQPPHSLKFWHLGLYCQYLGFTYKYGVNIQKQNFSNLYKMRCRWFLQSKHILNKTTQFHVGCQMNIRFGHFHPWLDLNRQPKMTDFIYIYILLSKSWDSSSPKNNFSLNATTSYLLVGLIFQFWSSLSNLYPPTTSNQVISTRHTSTMKEISEPLFCSSFPTI